MVNLNGGKSKSQFQDKKLDHEKNVPQKYKIHFFVKCMYVLTIIIYKHVKFKYFPMGGFVIECLPQDWNASF